MPGCDSPDLPSLGYCQPVQANDNYIDPARGSGEESEEDEDVAMEMALQEEDPEAKELDELFQLEKTDPKHRMGNYLYVLKDYFEKLIPRPRLPFFSWVDGVTVATFKEAILANASFRTLIGNKSLGYWSGKLNEFQTNRVKYKSPLINKYKVVFQQGLVYRWGRLGTQGQHAGKWIDTGKLFPYTTTQFDSRWSGNGWGIWVQSSDETFFSNRMKIGKFQHSSFLAGDKVAGAGEWQVQSGVIKKISGRSGHYKPGLDHLRSALRALQKNDVLCFDQIQVTLYKTGYMADKDPVDVNAREVVQNRGLAVSYKVDPNAIG